VVVEADAAITQREISYIQTILGTALPATDTTYSATRPTTPTDVFQHSRITSMTWCPTTCAASGATYATLFCMSAPRPTARATDTRNQLLSMAIRI